MRRRGVISPPLFLFVNQYKLHSPYQGSALFVAILMRAIHTAFDPFVFVYSEVHLVFIHNNAIFIE